MPSLHSSSFQGVLECLCYTTEEFGNLKWNVAAVTMNNNPIGLARRVYLRISGLSMACELAYQKQPLP
jgi:hypothetical protein